MSVLYCRDENWLLEQDPMELLAVEIRLNDPRTRSVAVRCAMADDNNPIITCTVKQLAWAAWQLSRGKVEWTLGEWCPMLDDNDGDKARFEMWWTWATSSSAVVPEGAANPLGSMRDLIESAWNKAREHRSFGNFWQNIVAAQPKIM